MPSDSGMLLALSGRRATWILSVAQLRERRAFVRGNMVGLAALDLILRRVGARTVSVALVVEVTRVDSDDRAADAPGLRVPTNSISNFVPFSHWVSSSFRLRASFGRAFGIVAKADLIERLAVLGGLH